ncbi:hypothetical protein PAPYR_12825 [Paratrimastix pyriformis]|uniref:Nascent polypeptide-associated complex subunit alpha-like UBA domain-containing protein n=1 Tax=Paratrimastix pyriformis TaxID=342808 RepID=A0ABQ8U4Z5_9EUKA|nr:hypothetical protein PAPYR_12825 [Paratrimastix pyriformis]
MAKATATTMTFSEKSGNLAGNTAAMSQAMSGLSVHTAEAAATTAVAITKADVDFLIAEFEITKDVAEKTLRAASGDITRACNDLIRPTVA